MYLIDHRYRNIKKALSKIDLLIDLSAIDMVLLCKLQIHDELSIR